MNQLSANPSSDATSYQSVLDEQLAYVTTTLCRVCWDNKQLDAILLTALGDCLVVLKAAAFIARYAREDVTLKHAIPQAKISDEVLDEIAAALAIGPHQHGEIFYREIRDLHVIGTAISEPPAKDLNGQREVTGHRAGNIVGHAAVCFPTLPPEGADRDKMKMFHSRCTSALLWQVLQQRVRVFLPVAPREAERYWSAARRRGDGDTLVPPWESRGEKPYRTVTLGFDLRKSTFCMENADDPKEFAFWLDDMVQILMRVSHRYDGIFDKFTGDGALVHFPVDAKGDRIGSKAVTTAVLCAIAMQKAMNLHLSRLRKFLRLDSTVVGGAIGIDVADARWTLDERDNPITVGRGVVNACRLMDSTKARKVRLTNIAYQTLGDPNLKALFVATPFTSKEFGVEMGIIAWELQDAVTASLPHWDARADERVVGEICEKVWQRRI